MRDSFTAPMVTENYPMMNYYKFSDSINFAGFLPFLGAALLRLQINMDQGSIIKLAPAWLWQWSADWPQQSMTRHRT